MGQVIAFATHKGGVGKTTLTIHMAHYLAKEGHRVAVIDADPQGNATSWVMDGRMEPGFHDMIVRQAPVTSCIRVPQDWGFAILPGNYRTGTAMEYLTIDHAGLTIIQKLIEPLTIRYDYILIDTPPTMMTNYEKVLYAADWLIVPTQLERFALEGISRMANVCVAQGRPKLLGIVPNMTIVDAKEHKANMLQLLDTFGPLVWPDIPASRWVPVTQSRTCTIWDLPNTSRMRVVFDRIGKRLVENAQTK